MATMTWIGPVQIQEVATLALFLMGVEGSKDLDHLPLLSHTYQVAGSELEQLELEPAPMWNAGDTDGNLAHSTTMLIPNISI